MFVQNKIRKMIMIGDINKFDMRKNDDLHLYNSRITPHVLGFWVMHTAHSTRLQFHFISTFYTQHTANQAQTPYRKFPPWCVHVVLIVRARVCVCVNTRTASMFVFILIKIYVTWLICMCAEKTANWVFQLRESSNSRCWCSVYTFYVISTCCMRPFMLYFMKADTFFATARVRYPNCLNTIRPAHEIIH